MTCCFALNLEEICQTYFIMHDIVQEMVKLPKKGRNLYTADNWPD